MIDKVLTRLLQSNHGTRPIMTCKNSSKKDDEPWHNHETAGSHKMFT